MEKNTCIICKKPLNDGIMIKGRRICCECELKMIRAQIDTDFYEYFKEKIRRSIVHCMIKREREGCQNYHL